MAHIYNALPGPAGGAGPVPGGDGGDGGRGSSYTAHYISTSLPNPYVTVYSGSGGYGGSGGSSLNGVGGNAGAGANAGSASANASMKYGYTSRIAAGAAANGGQGGSSGLPGTSNLGAADYGHGSSAGAGGATTAMAYAYNLGYLGPAEARAVTNDVPDGALGGSAYGTGNPSGAGGIATIAAGTVIAKGSSATAGAYLTGGNGGYGRSGANGGAGATSTLTNAVSGATSGGSLYLKQFSTGGSGGNTAISNPALPGTPAAGTAGAAGNATSSLTFDDTTNKTAATIFDGESRATAGNGGGAGGASAGADGGIASGTINLTGAHVIAAAGYAYGGYGGFSYVSPGKGGDASGSATATSTTKGADYAYADIHVRGGPSGSLDEATISSSGGAGGAATGATATTTETTAIGGTAGAFAAQLGGQGGPAIGDGKIGGPGGAVSGTVATATGYNAYAKAYQKGGGGGTGSEGASGGAGQDSTLSNAASGTAKPGGSVNLRQTAIGGAGGYSNGGTPGAAGNATSILTPAAPDTTAAYLNGSSFAAGGAGGNGTTSGKAGGTATAALGLTGAHQLDAENAYATGGSGGSSSGAGNAGAGGTASALVSAETTTTGKSGVYVTVHAVGGLGGANTGAGNGGQGGAAIDAFASATQTQATGGAASAEAIEVGGTGGTGVGPGQGGAGGYVGAAGAGGAAAAIEQTTATANGYAAHVTVYQSGGRGGAGTDGANGGRGADSYLTNAATGTTTGGYLSLNQTATGGSGGTSDSGRGGGGGIGYSSLTYVDAAPAANVLGASKAYGGSGAYSQSGTGGAGNDATASIALTGVTAVLTFAKATGGDGGLHAGSEDSTNSGGDASATARATATSTTNSAGTASATAAATAGAGLHLHLAFPAYASATAVTSGGQQATAASTADGTNDLSGLPDDAQTDAKTSGTGAVTGVDAKTEAQLDGRAFANSTASIGGTIPTLDDAGVFASAFGIPSTASTVISTVIGQILSATGNVNIEALLGGAANATFLGYGTQGTFAESTASGPEVLTSTETFTLNPATLSGHLVLGLLGEPASTEFTSLTFNATMDGTVVATQTFNSNGDTTTPLGPESLDAFFAGNALDLGAIPTTGGPVTVTIGQTLTTSTYATGFQDTFLLAATPNKIATLLATPGSSTIIDLALAASWASGAPNPGDTVSFDLPKGGKLTGALNAALVEFPQYAGEITAVAAIFHLTGVGDPLAMDVASDVIFSDGTIAATGSITIESSTGASLTALDGEQIGVQGIVVGFDPGDSGALTVSGASTDILNTGTDGSLLIGGSGSGVVTVTGGAFLTDAAVDTVGATAGGAGELDITAGGNLTNQGLVVGDAGLGSMAITSGGTVVDNPGTSAVTAVIANQYGAAGSSVNVVGAGSDWQVRGALVVGNADEGSLNIATGGTVSATSLVLGSHDFSSGLVAISGNNSSLAVTGTVYVGGAGSGELSILSGANVNIGGDFDIGQTTGDTGDVDIEDPTGTVYVGGNLNLGDGAAGVLTVGPNSTLEVDNGGVIAGPHGVENLFSAIDPFFSDGGTANILDSADQIYKAYVESTSFNLSPGITYTLSTPIIYGSSGFALGANASDSSGVELILNADSLSAASNVTFNDALSTLVIGADVLPSIELPASGTGPFTAAPNPNLGLPLIGGFSGTIKDFQVGDTIVVDTKVAATFHQNGSLVSVIANTTTLGVLTFDSLANATLAVITPGALVDQAPCFAAGTRIATDRGEVAVEDLCVGDLVRTVLGDDLAPIIWVGQREVDCARHPKPRTVWPVRVSAGAFGPGQPHTDLFLSPDHAVYVGEVLIPVKHLINGSTIVQVQVDNIVYHHIELAQHDVVLAHGLPAESFLDMRDGTNYANRPGPARLYPDYSVRMWEAFGCARLIVAGPELDAARALVGEYAKVRDAA